MTTEQTQPEAPQETQAPKVEIIPTSEQLQSVIGRLEKIIKESRCILSLLKSSRKEVTKMEKKKGKRVKDPNRPKKPASGFGRPTSITEELSNFLEIPVGELIARTEVTRRITTYIKKFDLQRPEDRRKINLDLEGGQPLRDLLNVGQEQQLDFFNLQSFLKVHFIKGGAAVVPPTTSTSTPTVTPTVKTKTTTAAAEIKAETTPTPTTTTKKRAPRTRKRKTEVAA
jgi:chromatin remodeling complex protein RSC6